MTRTKKPPTLADLRRLAKRKLGPRAYVAQDMYGYLQCGNDPDDDNSLFIEMIGDEMRVAMFGALAALPDAPRKASGHE